MCLSAQPAKQVWQVWQVWQGIDFVTETLPHLRFFAVPHLRKVWQKLHSFLRLLGVFPPVTSSIAGHATGCPKAWSKAYRHCSSRGNGKNQTRFEFCGSVVRKRRTSGSNFAIACPNAVFFGPAPDADLFRIADVFVVKRVGPDLAARRPAADRFRQNSRRDALKQKTTRPSPATAISVPAAARSSEWSVD